MSRGSLALSLAFVVAAVVSPRAQQATPAVPDLSGRWMLVSASGPVARQEGASRALLIAQSPGRFTLEQQNRVVHFLPGNVINSEAAGSSWSTFIVDGAEHDLPPMQSTDATGFVTTVTRPGTYRTSWTGQQLIIMIHDMFVMTGRDQQPFTVRRTLRQAFTLGRDGTLTTDMLDVADPMPAGFFFFNLPDRMQEPPENLRNVYRKPS